MATRYYHYDGLGSTQLLTDENGNVTDSYANTAFGEPVSTGAENPTTNPFRFVGQFGYYINRDVGDYYVRARAFSDVLARWLSPDPIGLVDQRESASLYKYANNSPTVNVDPSGQVSLQLGASGLALAPLFPSGPVFVPLPCATLQSRTDIMRRPPACRLGSS